VARIQPVLTSTELVLVDQMAALTGSKRTEVIKSALTVYHWFVRQALIGSQVVARKPTGEEVALETAELAVLEGKGNRLGPEELGLLASSSRWPPIQSRRHASKSVSRADSMESSGRGESRTCRKSAAKMSRPLCFSSCSTASTAGRYSHLS
jgi:hypothetical protein